MLGRFSPSYYRSALDHLYTRKGFDRTRLYVALDGSSYVGCPCHYCGDNATSEDHVYPLIAVYALYGTEDLPPARLLIIVPACHECNLLLSTKVFPNIDRRKHYVKRRLRERHRRRLSIPEWEPSELARLSPRMQEYVLLGLQQKEHLENRLAW